MIMYLWRTALKKTIISFDKIQHFFRFPFSYRQRKKMFIFPFSTAVAEATDQLKGTSIYCREKPEDKADGAEKPECTRRT
jgi:hypothetical protein